MVKIVISGISGRMGIRIAHMIEAATGAAIGGGLERPGSDKLGQDIGDLCGLGRNIGVAVSDQAEDVIKGAGAIIDFTSPEATLEKLHFAVKHGVPMVIGTTGFSVAEKEQIAAAGKLIPCVFAPNMSVGINLLLKTLKQMAQVTADDYDVEIIEAHHHFKKDAPSGTALGLAEAVADGLGRNLAEVATYGREGMVGERDPQEIGIHTVRGGDIVGTHTVMFAGIGETIEVTHRAQSRDTFAQGAVKAALFAATATPGSYTMQDVLNLR